MLFPRAKTRVIHRKSGYRGYMDQKPIRKPNWHMIVVIVGGLFCCGALSSAIGILTLPGLFGGADPLPTEMIAVMVEPTETTSAQLIANVSTAQPTHTPTQTATPTNTPTATRTLEPTQDALQMTVDAVSTNLAEIRAQTHVPTFTPEPDENTATPEPTRREYSRMAIVQFDNVVVRSGPGANYQAVTMAWYGERFGVIDERTTDSAQYSRWIRIDHPMHSSAWIASHLVRIDDE